jgi:hypothetical protein
MPVWSREIYEKLSEDWSHLRFTIKVTDADEIVVSFDTDLLQQGGGLADTALARYMGNMSRHGVAAERRLRKRGDRWRVTEYVPVVSGVGVGGGGEDGQEGQEHEGGDRNESNEKNHRRKPDKVEEGDSEGYAVTIKTEFLSRDDEDIMPSDLSCSSKDPFMPRETAHHAAGGDGSRECEEGIRNGELKEVLVFSFFAPWVTSAPFTAQKAAASDQRRRARHTIRTRNAVFDGLIASSEQTAVVQSSSSPRLPALPPQQQPQHR